MVAGQVGVDGLLARKPVQPVLNNVLGAVRAQRPVMAGNLVKEQRGKVKSVMHIRVQVRQMRTQALFLAQAMFNLIEMSFCERRINFVP